MRRMGEFRRDGSHPQYRGHLPLYVAKEGKKKVISSHPVCRRGECEKTEEGGRGERDNRGGKSPLES